MKNVACNCNGITLFISVNTHIRYSQPLDPDSPPREQQLIILFPFRHTNWPFLRMQTTTWGPRCNGQRDMIYQPNYETYHLHTQHLIYNCNISVYFLWRNFFLTLDTTTLSSPSSFVNFRLPMNHMIRRAATGAACPRNSHGVAHKRSLPQSIAPIPDLRSNLSISAPGFTGIHTLPHKESISCLLGGHLLLRVAFPWTDVDVFF